MLTDDKFSVCLWKERSFFSEKHCGLFPDFCLLSKSQYKCFDNVPRTILNEKINFFFVNQISGVKENVLICPNDHIDNHDKCYESNHKGPNIIQMPRKIVSHNSRLSIVSKFAEVEPTFVKNTRKRNFSDDLFHTKYVLNGKKKTRQVVCFKPNLKIQEKNEKLLFVPFLLSPGTFALVKKDDLKKYTELLNGVTKEEFDKSLGIMARRKVDMKIVNADHSINTFIYLDTSGEKSEPQISEFIDHDFSHYDCKNRFLVSAFVYANEFHDSVNISHHHISLFHKAYGNVKMNRYQWDTLGCSLYQGVGSSIRNTSPLCGYESRKTFQLGKEKNNNRFVPVTEKLTNKLAGQAFDYGSYIDPAMVLVHPKSRDHNSTRSCRLKIMTCPTEHGISFACSSHLDKKDILSKTDNEIALSKVRTILKDKKLPNKKRQRAQYLIDFYNEFGTLVLPTTCVYQFIEGEKHTVWQYFLFTGLSLAIRLETHICNFFMGQRSHTAHLYQFLK